MARAAGRLEKFQVFLSYCKAMIKRNGVRVCIHEGIPKKKARASRLLFFRDCLGQLLRVRSAIFQSQSLYIIVVERAFLWPDRRVTYRRRSRFIPSAENLITTDTRRFLKVHKGRVSASAERSVKVCCKSATLRMVVTER